MIYLKNQKFQDLSKYIPLENNESEFFCLQTRHNLKDSTEMIQTIDHMATEVYQLINPESTANSFFPLLEDDNVVPEVGPRIVWTNKYITGQRTGMHAHDDPTFIENADHIAIYILEVGSQPEIITMFDKNDIQHDIVVSPGDLIIGHATQKHCAPPVKEKLVAMMFKIDSQKK